MHFHCLNSAKYLSNGRLMKNSFKKSQRTMYLMYLEHTMNDDDDSYAKKNASYSIYFQ